MNVLAVGNLRVNAGDAAILAGVSLSVAEGQILAVTGGSGIGKSTLINAAGGLLPDGLRVTGGSVTFLGRDMFSMSERELDALRGAELAFVFQEPMSAFNPLTKLYKQIAEPLTLRRKMSRKAALAAAVTACRRAALNDPERAAAGYPHELSGGMLQRAALAAALISEPKLILADEPTAALDEDNAAVIARVFREYAKNGGAALIVTHDLKFAGAVSDGVYKFE